MVIKKDHSDLRPSAGPNAPLPSAQTVIARPLLERWWKRYSESPEFTRERAIPELPLRASAMALRCDRALWYSIREEPVTNPPDVSNVWRMRLGQLIGEEIANDAPNLYDEANRKHGWWKEDAIDLSIIGYPGSAHGDLVHYDHGQATSVVENKSVGGFQFKMKATGFNGDAEGPTWAHIMQAAIVAHALGAPRIIIFYIAPEACSPDVAARLQLDEFEKFTAEWHYDTADLVPAIELEIARQKRILRLTVADDDGAVWLPERTLDAPGEIPAGAIVDNPAKGHWVVLSPTDGSVIKAGSKWFCGYCDHRDRCLDDGEEMRQVIITTKEATTP